jgi:hypothetical protein
VEEVAYTIASENGNAVRTQARIEAKSAVLRYVLRRAAYGNQGTKYPGLKICCYIRAGADRRLGGSGPGTRPAGAYGR